jgi:uncharacterized protein (DUF58 family)
MPEPLLTGSFLKKLESHELVSRRVFSSRMAGERRSSRKGGGLEFVDFKSYATGDDLRYLDWNVFARSERLVIKQFETTENLATYVLLDTSASMDFGSPTKLLWGKRMAAALGYLALCRDDRYGIFPFAEEMKDGMLSLTGRGQVTQVFDFISGLQPAGTTSLETAIQQFTAEITTGGLVFIVSDFWDVPGLQRGLHYLLYGNFLVHALHVLTPEEVQPGYSGELDLTDAETGERVLLTVKKGTLDRYQRELQTSFRQLQALLSGPATLHLRFTTEDSVEDAVLYRFQKEGLLA